MSKIRGLITGYPDHSRRISGILDNDDNLALSLVLNQEPATRRDLAIESVRDLSNNFAGPSTDGEVWTIYWRPDGKMFFWFDAGDYFRRISCTTPWDMSTGTADVTTNMSSLFGITANYTFWFRNDGLKLYFADAVHDGFIEFELRTAWDISQSSLIRHNADFNGVGNYMDAGGYRSNMWGSKFGDSGSKFYSMNLSDDNMRQYSLTTAYDVSSGITYDGLENFNSNGGNSAPIGFEWKPDGSTLWIVDIVGDLVAEYSVSTAWDITSTVTEEQTFYVGTQEASPSDITWKPDGTMFFVSGLSGNGIDTYTCTTAWDISTASHTRFTSLGYSRPQQIQWNDDGTQLIFNRDESSYDTYVYVRDVATAYDTSSTSTTTALNLTGNHWDRNITVVNYNDLVNTTYLDGIRGCTYGGANGQYLTVFGGRADGNDSILQFPLKTNYDAKTYYDGVVNLRSYSTTNTDFKAIHVSPDGTLFSAFDRATQQIVTIQTTEPWKLGTRDTHHTNLGKSNQVNRGGAAVDDLAFHFLPDGKHVAMFDKTQDILTIHKSDRPAHRFDSATWTIVTEITLRWLGYLDDRNQLPGSPDTQATVSNREGSTFIDEVNAFQIIFPPTGPEIYLMDQSVDEFYRVPLKLPF
mgnify:CR=1 FL=1